MAARHRRLPYCDSDRSRASELDADSSDEESDATDSDSSGSEDEKIPLVYVHKPPSRKLWWIALGVLPLLVGGGLAAGLLVGHRSSPTSDTVVDTPSILAAKSSSMVDAFTTPTCSTLGSSTSSPAEPFGTVLQHTISSVLGTLATSTAQTSSTKTPPIPLATSSPSASSPIHPSTAPPPPPPAPPIPASSLMTGQATIHRTGGPHSNAAVQASLDSTAATLPVGKYWIQNVATTQYMSFLRGAFVVPAHTGPNCLLTMRSSASPVTLSYATTAASNWNPSTGAIDWVTSVPRQVVLQGVGTRGGCAAAQWDADLGGNKALVSYPCFANAMSPLIKFVWYIVPKDAGTALPHRSIDDPQYFLITGNHIGGMVTTAATGSNLTAWNDQMGIALTDFVATDPWQLWRFERVP